MRMGIEMVDAKVVFFQQSRRQFCSVILGFLILGIIGRTHDALNCDCPAIAVATTISNVPAAQTVGQILPCTDIVHIVVHTNIVHVAVNSGTGILLGRRCACGSCNPSRIVNGHTDDMVQ